MHLNQDNDFFPFQLNDIFILNIMINYIKHLNKIFN